MPLLWFKVYSTFQPCRENSKQSYHPLDQIYLTSPLHCRQESISSGITFFHETLANFQKISEWNPSSPPFPPPLPPPSLPLNVNLEVYYRSKREITKGSSIIKKSIIWKLTRHFHVSTTAFFYQRPGLTERQTWWNCVRRVISYGIHLSIVAVAFVRFWEIYNLQQVEKKSSRIIL